MSDSDVDTRHSSLATPNSPTDYAHQLPGTAPLAHHWSATVTLACVLALFTTGTNETGMQLEIVAQSGVLHLTLTLSEPYDRHVNFFKDVLVFAKVTKGVFTPTGCPTPSSGVIILHKRRG